MSNTPMSDTLTIVENICLCTWSGELRVLPFNGGGMWRFDGAFYWKEAR